ncbi:YbfB/YjiJ family MFS transporter [Candidatus Aalborgicola defluviihabitans]|uniref:YbfB/YjiJ family MFS transporter n=1 Tax=Candidatus Aalborgicola defluviihabitans TaxID=3386187 RepID=UPI0039B8E283
MALFAFAYGLAGLATSIRHLPAGDCPPSRPGSRGWICSGRCLGWASWLSAGRLRAFTVVRDLRLLLIACYLIQAVGIATSLISPTLGGFTLGSLLLGLPFTAITFFAMQELRRPPTHSPLSWGWPLPATASVRTWAATGQALPCWRAAVAYTRWGFHTVAGDSSQRYCWGL